GGGGKRGGAEGMAGGAGDGGSVLLDGEEEIGRDQDGLQGEAQRLREGGAARPRLPGQAEERSHVPRGDGPAIGATRQLREVASQAATAMAAVEVSARVHALQARARRALRRIVWPDDLELAHARVRGRRRL